MPKLRNKVANTARRNIVDIVPFKGLECLFLYRFVAISSTSSYLWLITFVINSLRQPKATKDTRNKHTMPFKRKMSTYIPTSSINNYFPLIWLSRISTLNTGIKLVDKIVIIIFMGHYRPLKFIIIGLAKQKKGLIRRLRTVFFS